MDLIGLPTQEYFRPTNEAMGGFIKDSIAPLASAGLDYTLSCSSILNLKCAMCFAVIHLEGQWPN